MRSRLAWPIVFALLCACYSNPSAGGGDPCARLACDANAVCGTTGGAAVCRCAAGFSGDGTTCADVDECLQGTDDCSSDATCENASPGFVCSCKPGFSGDGVTCADVDGCAGSPCFLGVTCTDVPAPGTGFTCGPCPATYVGDGIDCSPLPDCTGDPGVCAANSTCQDTGGGVMRCTCNGGFAWSGSACDDVDECAAGPGICGPYRTCENTPGAYSCPCASGYVGDETMCSLLVANCSQCDGSADCGWVSGQGKYACVCEPGYLGVGSPGSCVATGYSLASTIYSHSGYAGQCTSLDLVKKQGSTQVEFDGESIALSGSGLTTYSDAGCTIPTETLTATAGTMDLLVWVNAASAGYAYLDAWSQTLGRASASFYTVAGPPVALSFLDTPTLATTNGCMHAYLGFVDDQGAAAGTAQAVTARLSSDGGVGFSSSSICSTLSDTLDVSISNLATSASFWFKSSTGTDGLATVRASDQAAALSPAALDVTFSAPVASSIRFDKPSYRFGDTTNCVWHTGALQVVDAAGNQVATSAPLAVALTAGTGATLWCSSTNTPSCTIGAGASSIGLAMQACSKSTFTLGASSSLGSASATLTIYDPCAGGCTPSGQPSSPCGCSHCCSGACMNFLCY